MGRTGVNHSFTASTTLNEYGEAPIYVILSKKRGILSGTPDFSAMPAVDAFEGAFNWNTATSLTTLELQHTMAMTGSRYVKTIPAFPLTGPGGLITLDEGGLDTPLSTTFTFTTQGAVLADSSHPQKIKPTLNQNTGTLGGSFKYPGTNATVILRGILLQHQQRGAGFFTPRNQPPGRFLMED